MEWQILIMQLEGELPTRLLDGSAAYRNFPAILFTVAFGLYLFSIRSSGRRFFLISRWALYGGSASAIVTLFLMLRATGFFSPGGAPRIYSGFPFCEYLGYCLLTLAGLLMFWRSVLPARESSPCPLRQ